MTETASTDEHDVVPPVNGTTYPAVERAYDFVLPSYQLLAARFEAADSRLTSLLTMATSLTIAAPIFGRAVHPEIAFSSRWFWAAAVLYGVAIVLGLIGRVRGSLTLVNPATLHETSLHLSDWDFRRERIYFAGQHFEANRRAVRAKGNTSIALTILLAAEMACFVAWLAG